MPDTSCRKCGGLLTKFSLCAECRKPIQQICTSCRITTSQVFHKDCFYHVDSFQSNIISIDTIFNKLSHFDKSGVGNATHKNYFRYTYAK